jgi:hypothetical protein
VSVSVGQVWESCDPRDNGRRVRVDMLSGPFVYVTNVRTHRESRVHSSRFDGKQWKQVTG